MWLTGFLLFEKERSMAGSGGVYRSVNIWQARNNLVFKNVVPNPQQIAHITLDCVLEWNGTSNLLKRDC